MTAKYLLVLALCYSSFVYSNSEFSHFFNSFNTLSANYHQQTYDEVGVPLGSSSGRLKFKRPAQFLWHATTPINQTLLLSNNELWLIDYELEQASMRPMHELQNTPLYWLITQPSQLKTMPKLTDKSQGVHWYSADDKNLIKFGFKNNHLVLISLVNQLGQEIIINFTNIAINPDITNDEFNLVLEDSFDIIR